MKINLNPTNNFEQITNSAGISVREFIEVSSTLKGKSAQAMREQARKNNSSTSVEIESTNNFRLLLCKKCNERKYENEFAKKNSVKSGRQSYCNSCVKAMNKINREMKEAAEKDIDEETFARVFSGKNKPTKKDKTEMEKYLFNFVNNNLRELEFCKILAPSSSSRILRKSLDHYLKKHYTNFPERCAYCNYTLLDYNRLRGVILATFRDTGDPILVFLRRHFFQIEKYTDRFFLNIRIGKSIDFVCHLCKRTYLETNSMEEHQKLIANIYNHPAVAERVQTIKTLI